MGLYTWEKVREEITARLNNPTKDQIANYIENAYRIGYFKGCKTTKELMENYLLDIHNGLKEATEKYEKLINTAEMESKE